MQPDIAALKALLRETDPGQSRTEQPVPGDDDVSQRVTNVPVQVESSTTSEPPALAMEPDILARFENDLALAGVAGETRIAKLTYLCLTSRLLEWKAATSRPVSFCTKGASSSGKSYTQRAAMKFFPKSAYIDLGSMSKKYLFYAKDDFAHKFIVIPEWSAIANDEEIVTAVRTLLSEGRLVHGTVEGEGRKEGREILKDGPTGLLMTTTAAAVDSELETRMLSDRTDDSPAQTRAIFKALAALEDDVEECGVHWDSWHELQTWLADEGANSVYVPFADALADLMPTAATRLRRDYGALLCLVRAHAILHQATRERDNRGRIIASLVDYAVVRDLVGDLVSEGADASVTPALRATVEAVRDLMAEDPTREYVTVTEIAERLTLDRHATLDRVKRASMKGYLTNQAHKHERKKKIVLGEPLPGEDQFLPDPAALAEKVRGEEDDVSYPTNGLTMRDSDPISEGKRGKTGTGVTGREIRRLLETYRPELVGRDDITTPAERREIAHLLLLDERLGFLDAEGAAA